MKFVATLAGKDKYLSIGFGKTMTDADMLIFQATASGAGVAKDYWSTGRKAPGVDKIDDL